MTAAIKLDVFAVEKSVPELTVAPPKRPFCVFASKDTAEGLKPYFPHCAFTDPDHDGVVRIIFPV